MAGPEELRTYSSEPMAQPAGPIFAIGDFPWVWGPRTRDEILGAGYCSMGIVYKTYKITRALGDIRKSKVFAVSILSLLELQQNTTTMTTDARAEVAKEDVVLKEFGLEASPYDGFAPEDAEIMRQFEGAAGKKVFRKVHSFLKLFFTITHYLQIDMRLIPVMGVLYLMAHIDRANIGNAKIEGMGKDLKLVGNQYNIASTIFFVPYILFGESVPNHLASSC